MNASASSSSFRSSASASRICALAILVAAVVTCAIWGCQTLCSVPFIVPPDSDLGEGARQCVRDAGKMFLCSLAAVALTCPLVSWTRTRIAIAAGMLVVCAAIIFESDSFAHRLRWPCMVLLAWIIVAALGESRKARGYPLSLASLVGLMILLPSLVVLTDWRARICLGLLPARTFSRGTRPEGIRPSITYFDQGHTALAESSASGLRASVDRHRVLAVQGMGGGPAFQTTTTGELSPLLAFSLDGHTLALADNHQNEVHSSIIMWHVAPSEPGSAPSVVLRDRLGGLTARTRAFDFFPDGRTLISAHDDHTVRLWDTVAGSEIARFVAHQHPRGCWDVVADCVAASPDGQTFATWAWDSIKLWDRDTQELRGILDKRDGLARWMSFTQDGRYLVTADGKAVEVWDLRPSWFPSSGFFIATVCLIGYIWLLTVPGRWSSTHKPGMSYP